MRTIKNWVPFQTIVLKEIARFTRLWSQTILPSAITMTLYFVIFGSLIGSRIGNLEGVPYINYIAPGLIMMAVITNAYANVTSSFFIAKFDRSVEEIIVSPTSNYVMLLGYVTGAVLRGLVVGLVVTVIAAFFGHFTIQHMGLTVLVIFLSAVLFSVAGFINAIFAKKFDDIALIPTFVLTPLTYLGGVFYSISMLPPIWQFISKFNPILYMVSAFRCGILGVSDASLSFSLAIIVGLIIVLTITALYLLNKGVGIRT
jgi:ABC-2 type transport system permease protein